MAHQLVDFPAHHLPPSTSGEASPLLNNSLLQTTFLMQHVLLPTLYAALTPSSFGNKTKTRRFQNYLSGNKEAIDVINENLTDMIKKRFRKDGRIFDEDNEERCRKKRNLGYSNIVAQETLVDLQETVARKMLQKHLDEDIRGLLQSMLLHMEMQRESLRRMKTIHVMADAQDSRKKRASTRCRDPYFPVGSECFHVAYEDKLEWHEAISACHKLRGHLAEPENPKELVRALKKIKGRFNRAWIGGSDEEEEGNWRWLSGRSLSDSQDWRQGQPSNYSKHGDIQHCLAIVRQTPSGDPPLADFSCWAQRAYVCETEPDC